MKIFTDNCLDGGTYLVTGASSGIGRAVASMISDCGGKLIIGGRDEDRLKETCLLLSADKTHAMSARELSNADQTVDWIKELVGLHGPLAGVFHGAGVELIRPARMTKQVDLDKVFGPSIFAAFGVARAISQKNVLVDGGSAVFMSSVAGSAGNAGMTAYSASKAAVDGLVRSLACELAPRRIRVNAIAAAAVNTTMHERIAKGGNADSLAAYEKAHLLGFGEVDDVASAALFLLCGASRWITGATLAVDGGYMVR